MLSKNCCAAQALSSVISVKSLPLIIVDRARPVPPAGVLARFLPVHRMGGKEDGAEHGHGNEIVHV